MKLSDNFSEMTYADLEDCNGGGFFWVFAGGVWKLISDTWFD